MKFWKTLVLFYLGGMIYAGLELLWRGYSHRSMFLLGGACFTIIGKLNRVRPTLPLPWRTLTAAGIVTVLELGTGLIVNRDYRVWDYRRLPLNFHGQICLPFTLLWIPLCLAAIFLYDWMDEKLVRKLHSS